MPHLTPEEIEQITDEAAQKGAKLAIEEYKAYHNCPLTAIQIRDLSLVSGFLTKFRNAAGNVVMVFVFAVILSFMGLLCWAISGGKVNPLKFLGLG